MGLLAQNRYSIRRVVSESFRFIITPETIALPSNNDVSDIDFSTAHTRLKLTYNEKEVYPNYDDRLLKEIDVLKPTNLDAQINAALIKKDCNGTVVNGVLSITSLTANAGYIDITIEYGGFKQTKRLTLAQSKEGNMTFFAKPTNYKKGDRWVLVEDTQLLDNFYKKGQALEAVYATGNDSDWRLLVFADETDGINLVRNYTYKERTLIVEGETKIIIPHWENAPKEAFVMLDDEIPTEFYNTSINVIGDEYGANYIITSEDDEAIQFDE